MGFNCGIVGLPNVGKSTLFNALTKNDVLAANYPFATIEPNVGVVGVPDDRLGERVVAVVEATSPDGSIDEVAVRDHCLANLARYKVPRDVEFLDSLPRNATGKVLKRELA